MISPDQAKAIVDAVKASSLTGSALRKFAMQQLDQLPTYNWSGIYRLEGDTLVLDEYVGAETDHTRIPVGRGVCGTAVAERANQVIADVRELTNYLSCSVSTRSELVVLIYTPTGEILGQIDIDGHEVGAFDESDEKMLEEIASILAERWEEA
ncbi:MAG: GAF domain-containing protein [Fimbriimonadaceae bacterium]|nr:GAF domain-containing protein [Fimbriimonadaceae bacterium]